MSRLFYKFRIYIFISFILLLYPPDLEKNLDFLTFWQISDKQLIFLRKQIDKKNWQPEVFDKTYLESVSKKKIELKKLKLRIYQDVSAKRTDEYA